VIVILNTSEKISQRGNETCDCRSEGSEAYIKNWKSFIYTFSV